MAENKSDWEYVGYKMTEKQAGELGNTLREDILSRYDNDEYHDPDIIESFAIENHLEKI